MTFILAAQRDSDVVAAFREYDRYLRDNAFRFPKLAYALATSDWWYDFNDHRCPHDAWLEFARFSDSSSGTRSLTVRLMGAYQDGHIELIYPTVYSHLFGDPQPSRGHDDWRYDEFRVDEQGHLIHEIEWASWSGGSTWIIEASDVQYRWLPRELP